MEHSIDEVYNFLKKMDSHILELTNEVEALRIMLHEKSMTDDFITLPEAAKMLGKSYQQCLRYINSGQLEVWQTKAGATYKISKKVIEEFKKRKREKDS